MRDEEKGGHAGDLYTLEGTHAIDAALSRSQGIDKTQLTEKPRRTEASEMPDGNPIRIGQANTASNPGNETSLSRNENTAATVFVARNLNLGDGIRGEASGGLPGGPDSYGVVGHREGGGFGAGVQGSSDSVMGVVAFSKIYPAVFASASYIDDNGEEVGSTGTLSHSFGRGGIGVSGRGGLIGTYGLAFNSADRTAPIAGVTGEVLGGGAKNSPGVIGRSGRGPGVQGISTNGSGVHGVSGDGVGSGVLGWGINGVGALGRDRGVLALSTMGPAGDFWGDVEVHGTLHKTGGGFRIDHPQTPENKYLTHSFVESDDMKNVYDGVAILDASGTASVELPSWFQELNGDYRYQLTPIGEAAPDLHIAKEVTENSFEIAGGHPGLKVCWQVTGTRQDPWANANRIEVEEDKAEGERGYYLHPDLYDQPEDQGIGFAALPEEVRQMKQQLEEEVQPPELPSILDDPRLEEHRQQMEELKRRYPPPSQRTESSEE